MASDKNTEAAEHRVINRKSYRQWGASGAQSRESKLQINVVERMKDLT